VTRSATETRLRRALARNVRRLREQGGFTLEEVSYRAGMAWRHWQKVEAGEVNATLRTLARLADALGVTVTELASGA
jgi:transcriptional regulator with XRE-family HTH domain